MTEKQILLEEVLEIVRRINTGESKFPEHFFGIEHIVLDHKAKYSGCEVVAAGGGPTIMVNTEFEMVLGQSGTSDCIERPYNNDDFTISVQNQALEMIRKQWRP